MKNHNKSNTLAMVATAALLVLSVFANTAHADYKGYWLDTVRSYQANHPRDYQPAPASYLDNPQTPAYREPAYPQAIAQPEGNDAPVPAGQPQYSGQAPYSSR